MVGEEQRFLFPLAAPLLAEAGLNYNKTARAILKLPEHEALAYESLFKCKINIVLGFTKDEKILSFFQQI